MHGFIRVKGEWLVDKVSGLPAQPIDRQDAYPTEVNLTLEGYPVQLIDPLFSFTG